MEPGGTLGIKNPDHRSLKATNICRNHWLRYWSHLVFSTKDRRDLISPEIEDALYLYIHGIVENNGARLLIGNGTSNHSHFLISLGKNDIGELTGDIKRDSSLWIKRQDPAYHNFYWQRGYGAFSVGQSQVAAVTEYIRNQKQHHAGQTYEDEFRVLCRKYGVEIDERYCWD